MKTRQISAWIAVGLLATSAVFTSCSKDEDDVNTLPPIGGYNSSNEVAASNLLAHWPFDGSNNERISGTAGTAVNAKFATGASGQRQALDLASGYVSYPAIAAITGTNSLPSFTISTWVNVKNNKGGTNSAAAFFTLARAKEWAGNINLMAETGRHIPTVDTLEAKGLLVTKAADGTASFQDNVNSIDKGGDQAYKVAGKWTHFVMVYDASTSRITLYGDGKKINNPDYEERKVNGALLGNFTQFPVTNIIIGAWGTNLPGQTAEAWQVPMTGQIDEVRVYNKALSVGDIGSLYQLEQAGR